MPEVELDVGFPSVSLVDADQRVVSRIELKEAACRQTSTSINNTNTA